MTWVEVAAVLGGLSGLGGLAALLQALRARRAGVSADERAARAEEREDRRDTIADRDSLLGTLLGEVRDLRARVERAEAARLTAEDVSRRRSDHIDVLEHHIWRGKPPPPPPRPEGV